jgi:hypothetical protein
MSSAMSFMNTKNNKGPRTDPWGSPAFKSSNSDNASLIVANTFFTSIIFADVSKAFDRVWIGGATVKIRKIWH